MRKQVQLHTSNERRRIRDIIQKADQLRRDQVYQEPGGSYAGGGGIPSPFGGYLPGDGYTGQYDPPCFPMQEVAQLLEDLGDGSYGAPEGFTLTEAFFDGVNAMGKYDLNELGNVVPHGELDPETIISGLTYPN